MRLLFLGAGAVGGYFGGRLIEAGADVTFLVRPERAAALERDGLRIRSPLGDCDLEAKTVTRDSVTPDYDLVMLAPKAYDLAGAVESVEAAIGTRACILPFLNGLAHMDVLDARFGRDRVLGGVAHIAAVLESDGTVRQLSDLHVLTAGGRDDETQGVAAKFIDLCRPAKFDSVLSPDIETSLWEKWTLLATLAGITTLMQGSVGQIMETRDGEALIRQLQGECLAVASASGVQVSARARSQATALLTRRGSTFAASMLRDLSSGHRTEHDHVLGDMLARADRLGIAAPLLRAAYCHMQVRAAAH
ncbi:MAG: ketopantoate reductase family protein [Gammaproteobacteria bacterium]